MSESKKLNYNHSIYDNSEFYFVNNRKEFIAVDPLWEEEIRVDRIVKVGESYLFGWIKGTFNEELGR